MKRIEILREAHKVLKGKKYCYYANGLCVAIYLVLSEHGLWKWPRNKKYNSIDYDKIQVYFPLMTRENALKFGADKTSAFWWRPGEYGLFSGRRRFMRWLMRQYRNDKEELK